VCCEYVVEVVAHAGPFRGGGRETTIQPDFPHDLLHFHVLTRRHRCDAEKKCRDKALPRPILTRRFPAEYHRR